MSAVETTSTSAAPVTTTRRRPALPSTRLLRSELRLIGGRRRNQAGLAVLAAVPIMMAVVVRFFSSPGGGEGDGPNFLSSVTSNGLFVPLAALGVEVAMFLPLAMSMLAGDSIAGEANIGTLRYLLTVPVDRTRLLAVKYASLCIGAVWGVAAVVVPGAVVGLALFGAGPLPTLSGTELGFGEGLWRLVLASLYLAAGLAAFAAIGLFVSTLTEQPIGAAIAVMIVNIVAWILDAVPQLGWLHPWLFMHDWLSFADVMRDPVHWGNITHGLWVDLAYAVVFWLLSWARFAGKDITS